MCVCKLAAMRHADQLKLFDIGTQLPNGLIYRPNFITEEEEEILLTYLENAALRSPRYELPPEEVEEDNPTSYHSQRRSKGYGWEYDEVHKKFVPGTPLPHYMHGLQRKIAKWLHIPTPHVAEALINEYTPGASIGWHRDNEPFEIIVGISLKGWCRMRFRPLHRIGDPRAVVSIELEPRSVYIMQNDVRWRWQHSVTPVSTLRYSITLRTLPRAQVREAFVDEYDDRESFVQLMPKSGESD